MTARRIPVFTRERVVTDRDCDVLGHVNNLRWVRWVVELAEAHASALGYPFEACRERGGVWVVREQRLAYLRGALPGERLMERTWVSEMRGARCTRHARFEDSSGESRFQATTLWAFVDVETMRPTRVPAEMRERFDILESPESAA